MIGVGLNVAGFVQALLSGHTSALWWVLAGQFCIIAAIFLAHYRSDKKYRLFVDRTQSESRLVPGSFPFADQIKIMHEEQTRVRARKQAESEV